MEFKVVNGNIYKHNQLRKYNLNNPLNPVNAVYWGYIAYLGLLLWFWMTIVSQEGCACLGLVQLFIYTTVNEVNVFMHFASLRSIDPIVNITREQLQ